MAHPSTAGARDDPRRDSDRRVRLAFRGSQLGSDGGLLRVRGLDDALGLSDPATAALADLNGQWIDRFLDRTGLKHIVLDMDSSVRPTHGDQEGAACNGHFGCARYHPLRAHKSPHCGLLKKPRAPESLPL